MVPVMTIFVLLDHVYARYDSGDNDDDSEN